MSINQNEHQKSMALDQLTSIQQIVKGILETLGYPDEFYHLLKDPLRMLEVRIPVRMDDGSVKVFTGYRAHHNDAVGPTIGGVRFHPDVSRKEINMLALWITLKASIVDLPLGGAMGGVICDPRDMSFRELEALSRGYVRAIGPLSLHHQDILKPDLFTNPQIMTWMYDEYTHINKQAASSTVVGKPVVLGGVKHHNDSRANSVVSLIEQVARLENIDIQRASVVVQGFGHAGSHIAKRLYDQGAKIIGIADAYGAIHDPSGLDIDHLYNQRDSFGTITNLFEHTLSNQELLQLECDFLIPAAVSHQITDQNAKKIKAKVIVEAVNHSITSSAYNMLAKRNKFLVPDILTSTGHIVLSYIEWLQNNGGERWPDDIISVKVANYIDRAFREIFQTAQSRQIHTRDATYMVALRKIAEAIRLRGWV